MQALRHTIKGVIAYLLMNQKLGEGAMQICTLKVNGVSSTTTVVFSAQIIFFLYR